MSALILFGGDLVLYICELKDIYFHGKRCSAKYRDKKKYAARVLALSNSNTILEELKTNVENCVQCISDVWSFDGSQSFTYMEASKTIIQALNEVQPSLIEILIVDQHILLETRGDIHTFSILRVDDIDEAFFLESPQLIRLSRKSQENNNDCIVAQDDKMSEVEKISSMPMIRRISHDQQHETKAQPSSIPSDASDDVPLVTQSPKIEEACISEPENFRNGESIAQELKTTQSEASGASTAAELMVDEQYKSIMDKNDGIVKSQIDPLESHLLLPSTDEEAKVEETDGHSPMGINCRSDVPNISIHQLNPGDETKSSGPETVICMESDLLAVSADSEKLSYSLIDDFLSEIDVGVPALANYEKLDGKCIRFNEPGPDSTVIDETPESHQLENQLDINPFKNNVIIPEDGIFSDPIIYDSNEEEGSSSDPVSKTDTDSYPQPEKVAPCEKSHPKIIEDIKVNLSYSYIFKQGPDNSCLSHNFHDDNNNIGEPLLHSSIYESVDHDPNGAKLQSASPPSPENHAKVSLSAEESNASDSDNVYEPSIHPSESEEENDDGVMTDEEIGKQEMENLKQNEETVDSPLVSEKPLDKSLGIDPKASAPDDRGLHVDPSSSTTKKHFCGYCDKFQSKFARHLELRHSDEPEVAKFIRLPPKSKERQDIIAVLRKQGDHKYNTDKRLNGGSLLVCRRPNPRMKKTAEDFTTCATCRGQYSRSVFRHHAKKCSKRDGKRQRTFLVNGRKIAARIHERASIDVRTRVVPYLREDEIVRLIRYDELIILFANKLCEKYGAQQHLYQMIRGKLRLLGRLLEEMRSRDERIKYFRDIYHPRYYDKVIECIRVIAGFKESGRKVDHSSVATHLSTLIRQVGEVLRSECIKTENEEEKKKVIDFLRLREEDIPVSINRPAADALSRNYRLKKVILPSTEDVQALYTFATNERDRYFAQLKQGFSFETWKNLGKACMSCLQIFNRRRPGELERLFLEDYHSHCSIDQMTDKELFNTLSAEGKKLAQNYVRLEIRGKLGRGVPVLIDKHTLECLELLLQHREDAQVPKDNPYLFGLPSNDKHRSLHLHACEVMRDYSSQCGAEIPHILRGNQLRKHIATKCINLNLSSNQVDNLANFMGHDRKIHEGIYRQPVLQTDIVQMAKILNTCMEGYGSDNEEDIIPNTSRASMGEPSTSRDYSGAAGSSKNSMDDLNRTPRSSTMESGTPKRWTEEERHIVLSTFQRHLDDGHIPSGIEMQELIMSHACLKKRTVPQMRSWLHTQRKKMTNK